MLSSLYMLYLVTIWLLPLYRQYNSRYFGFFVVLAAGNPAGWLYMLLIKGNQTVVYLFVLCLMIFFLYFGEKRRKLIPVLFFSLLSIVIFEIFFYSRIAENYILLGLSVVAVYRAMSIASSEIVEKKIISVFHLTLVFYLLMVMFKAFNILYLIVSGINFFHYLNFADIIFVLLFSIVRYDDTKFHLRFGKSAA